MLAQCPQFEGDATENADMLGGINRHRAVQALVSSNDPLPLMGLPDDDRESCEWAADYIRCNISTGWPLRIEHHVNPLGEDFHPIFENGGTLDLDCGPDLFDIKSRPREYKAQLAAYAIALFQESGFAAIKCHVLFTATKRVETFTLTEAEALAIVNGVIEGTKSGEHNPCDYCGWCAKIKTCPAQLERVHEVVTHREDWRLDQYHASEIKTASEIGKALRLARQLSKWCDAVEHFAKLQAEQGVVPTGYKIGTTKGKTWITDTAAAFQLSGLPQDDFLKCCEPRLNTSKTYPDKLGVVDLYAKQNELPRSKAAKALKDKLAPVTAKEKDGIKLISTTATNEEEGEE
jgi:hypothetical protein